MNFYTLNWVSDNARIMTIEEYQEQGFVPGDGYGLYAKYINNKLYEDEDALTWNGPPDPEREFTHVAWYAR